MEVQDSVPHIADLHQEMGRDMEGLPLAVVRLDTQVEKKMRESICPR